MFFPLLLLCIFLGPRGQTDRSPASQTERVSISDASMGDAAITRLGIPTPIYGLRRCLYMRALIEIIAHRNW